MITSGGTQEPLDPVRVLTNRSSGKQGYALAQAALDAGADVTFISTPAALMFPIGAHPVFVQTAKEMLDAVLNESSHADALIMAAAVADFRPKRTAESKLKKRDGIPQVELEATEDILEAVMRRKSAKPASGTLDAEGPRVTVGFAAESQALLENAGAKLKSKKLDLIVANDISSKDAGFGMDTNRVTLLYPDGRQEPLPLMTKTEVADAIIERLAALLE